MKDKTGKFENLYRSLEIEEGGAIKERIRIEEIAAVRKNDLDKLVSNLELVKSEISNCQGNKRSKALAEGNSQKVAGLVQHTARLKNDCENLQKKVKKQSESFHKALERLKAAEEILLEKRVEKKKIEKLIETKNTERRIKKEALVEIDNEERSNFKNRS